MNILRLFQVLIANVTLWLLAGCTTQSILTEFYVNSIPSPTKLISYNLNWQTWHYGDGLEHQLPYNNIVFSNKDYVHRIFMDCVPEGTCLDQASYCIYAIQYDPAKFFSVWWACQPEITFWVGFGNWEKNRWDWYPIDGLTAPEHGCNVFPVDVDLDRYMNQDGHNLCAMVVTEYQETLASPDEAGLAGVGYTFEW